MIGGLILLQLCICPTLLLLSALVCTSRRGSRHPGSLPRAGMGAYSRFPPPMSSQGHYGYQQQQQQHRGYQQQSYGGGASSWQQQQQRHRGNQAMDSYSTRQGSYHGYQVCEYWCIGVMPSYWLLTCSLPFVWLLYIKVRKSLLAPAERLMHCSFQLCASSAPVACYHKNLSVSWVLADDFKVTFHQYMRMQLPCLQHPWGTWNGADQGWSCLQWQWLLLYATIAKVFPF